MLAAIDWSRPWYDAVRAAFVAGRFDARPMIDALNALGQERGMSNARGAPITFVPQTDLPEGVAYEAFIGATGGVPTRENLHDFFNALVWLTFPRIKQQLNALQAAQIARDGVGKSRGPARDGATIFDENSALLVVREGAAGRALVAALREHDWREVFCARRAAWGPDAQLWLFGHALMEKLVTPYKAITAHTRVVWTDDAFFSLAYDARRAWIDRRVADELASDGLRTADFTPLPVLGVPGWRADQDHAFYADVTVFRPKPGVRVTAN